MEVFYRRRDSHKLFITEFPYEHYIFTRVLNPVPGETYYRHLVNGMRFKKEYMTIFKAREMYKNSPSDTAEGDVSAEYRFVVDNYYDVDFPSDIKPRVFYYDIETEIVGDYIPTFQKNKAEITAFTIYDTYTDTYYHRAVIPNGYEYSSVSELQHEIEESLEEYNIKYDTKYYLKFTDLLTDLISFFSDPDMCPDIITSWNSPFDIPYTIRKVYDHFGEKGLKKLSPFKEISWSVVKALKDGTEPYTDNLIPGVSVIDDLELYKKYDSSEQQSYSLNAVSSRELESEVKVQYDTDFDTLYKKKFKLFSKYNVQDVRLMTLIEAKKKLIDLAIVVRDLSKADYASIFFESQSIDSLCLMKINRWREEGKLFVLPSKPQVDRSIPTPKYLGAYVKPTIQGRCKWVGDLDFKSMYPSIYDTFSLSNETVVGKVRNFGDVLIAGFKEVFPELTEDQIKATLLPGFSYFESSDTVTLEPRILYKDKVQEEFASVEEFREWLKENNYAIMCNGVVVDQNVDDAFLGSFAGEVMDIRDFYKVKMKEYDAAGDDKNALIYEVKSGGIKTINNSIYGVTAEKGFRLCDLDIAEAITSTGQSTIKSSTYLVNRRINGIIQKRHPEKEYRDVVLTNDTDSIIFTVEDLVNVPIDCQDVETLKKIVILINEGQKAVNNGIRSIYKESFSVSDVTSKKFRMFIKNEWVASSGLFFKKKCYVLHVIFKEGYMKPYYRFVGVSIKKSTTPILFQGFLKDLYQRILNFESQETINKLILDEAVKLKSYRFEDIAVPMGVAGIDGYVKNTPVHVRGAKVFNQYFAKSEIDKISMAKVKYLYVKRWITHPELNMLKEYVISVPVVKKEYWDDLQSQVVPDYEKLMQNLLLKPMEKAYEILHWEMPDIKKAFIKTNFSFIKKSKATA